MLKTKKEAHIDKHFHYSIDSRLMIVNNFLSEIKLIMKQFIFFNSSLIKYDKIYLLIEIELITIEFVINNSN